MCAHYEAVSKPERLHDTFKVAMPAGAVADVWPGYPGIFIRHPRDEQHGDGLAPWREAMAGSFGLIPHWAKDASLAKKTYNARSETVATKPSYRDAWRLGRRCIIPAEAFYEPDWRSGRAVPTRISRADGRPMGIAGIWTGWKAPDGSIVRSMSMLTVNADDHPLMKNFHRPEDERRMVVILDEGEFDAWLDPGLRTPERMLRCMDAGMLVAGVKPIYSETQTDSSSGLIPLCSESGQPSLSRLAVSWPRSGMPLSSHSRGPAIEP